jgi:hypothetical protein
VDRLGGWVVGGIGDQEPGLVAEHQPHPTVGGAEGSRRRSTRCRRRCEGVEVGGPVVVEAGGQHVGFEDRHGDGGALELGEHVGEGVEPRRRRADPLPQGRKRARAEPSTGSISLRRAASERRRIWRSTSGSHHSRSWPSGRNSPRTRRPSSSRATSLGSTWARSRPQRAATSAAGLPLASTVGSTIVANRHEPRSRLSSHDLRFVLVGDSPLHEVAAG